MTIGIIGLGDMGKLYATTFAQAGFIVKGCDLPENYELAKKELEPKKVLVKKTIQETLTDCELVIFSVETASIDAVVAASAPFIQKNCIIAGQTSVKTPEILAFEKYLPNECPIITVHSLHGPFVNPIGQIMMVVKHRGSQEDLNRALNVYKSLGSNIKHFDDYRIHDKMMADVQVVTHIGFESIGTSFMHRGVFPWENPLLTSGLDNLKLLLTLRIYSYKHHVYSGMAMLNPYSANDVRTYAQCENELFECIISQDQESLYTLVKQAGESVFGNHADKPMLSDEIMREYSLNRSEKHKPNSHLSLLSMVLTWHRLQTNPYDNLICQTPPFKLRVGMAEYLFLNENLLEESLQVALYDLSIRKDDLAFHTAVQEWAHIVENGDLKGYETHFEKTRAFLAPRLAEGRNKSNLLIERLNAYENSRPE